jgi:integrase
MEHSGQFTVREFKQSDGNRFCILIHRETGFPVELVARYLATEVWSKESENTTRSRLNAIKAFYEWALTRPTASFNPEMRLLEPDAIDLSDIKSFSLYLRARRRHKVLAAPGVDSRSEGRREVVAGHSVALYLSHVSDFVVWAAETHSRPKMSVLRINQLSDWFRDQVRSYLKTRQLLPKGLSEQQQRRLREICHPDSAENPFNKPVRFRNYAIVLLMLNTPLRRGELLGVRLEDMMLAGSDKFSVSVVVQNFNTVSAKMDDRKSRPRQKTRGREMPITVETKDALIAYLKHERLNPAKPAFVFLESRSGRPMSLGGVNNIFRRLQGALLPEFPDLRLYPHITRHTFNYNFKLHNLETGWPPEKLKQVQNYLNGWTDSSEQGALYGSKANIVIADKFVSEMQRKLKGENAN